VGGKEFLCNKEVLQEADGCVQGVRVSRMAVLVKNPKKGYEIGLTLHLLCDISRALFQSRGHVAYVSR
jgi:hypothetical protein